MSTAPETRKPSAAEMVISVCKTNPLVRKRTILWGKYYGKSFLWIAENDPGYLRWLGLAAVTRLFL